MIPNLAPDDLNYTSQSEDLLRDSKIKELSNQVITVIRDSQRVHTIGQLSLVTNSSADISTKCFLFTYTSRPCAVSSTGGACLH